MGPEREGGVAGFEGCWGGEGDGEEEKREEVHSASEVCTWL